MEPCEWYWIVRMSSISRVAFRGVCSCRSRLRLFFSLVVALLCWCEEGNGDVRHR